MKIIAVIPAFNEENRIEAALLALAPHVTEMVVVDDGSNDRTVEMARKTPAHVLRHFVNRGQGAALQTGMDYAVHVLGADIVVHFDADGQMNPEEIQEMIAPILSGESDIVLGSRFLGSTVRMPFMRRVILKLGTWLTTVLSGIAVTDTHNGFRALSRKATEEIHISLDRMAHASEIIDLIMAKKLRYIEVPVTIRYTEESLRKGQGTLGAVTILKDFFKGRFFDGL
ncbi:MAG: glycosyltransferase family 2 protein [Patescibacteria group bacterium]|jgi:glycosyltransferase involved in cell wall biosynthesis